MDVAERRDALLRRAIEVFGGVEAAEDWASRPHMLLRGVPPKEACADGAGLQSAMDILERLEHGCAV